ncbi:AIG2-like family-domain-containing protein [Amylocarpus encephaloides]|uniref:Putative gamma-glutamylcyclotransferase n=1 Tax=Amylocarpus encephaloides TaxID=45428 RepID=A0A9P7YJ17_9HELO|nr:AIG2-like family-domain-containing protein [Amylocarpus encephaloides]
MGDRKAFFYGTLMSRRILFRVIYLNEKADQDPVMSRMADQLTYEPAILHSYGRFKVQGYDYPGIRRAEGYCVRGTYVTGLTDANMAHLDAFEGSQYHLEKVRVGILESAKPLGEEKGEGVSRALEEGQEVEAETYVWNKSDVGLETTEWDFGEFVRDKLQNWVGSSDEYQESDDAHARNEGHDPTGGRGARSDKWKQ